MGKDQNRTMPARSRTSKLTEEEIEEIHGAFIETGGYVYRAAQFTGFARSTVLKYARKRCWYEEIQHSNNRESLDQEAKKMHTMDSGSKTAKQEKDGENEVTAEQVTPRLKELRELMFEEIMGKGEAEKAGKSSLKIPPRTLAEIIKALIDIDKRITEREGPQSDTALDTYRNILANCAIIVEDNEG